MIEIIEKDVLSEKGINCETDEIWITIPEGGYAEASIHITLDEKVSPGEELIKMNNPHLKMWVSSSKTPVAFIPRLKTGVSCGFSRTKQVKLKVYGKSPPDSVF